MKKTYIIMQSVVINLFITSINLYSQDSTERVVVDSFATVGQEIGSQLPIDEGVVEGVKKEISKLEVLQKRGKDLQRRIGNLGNLGRQAGRALDGFRRNIRKGDGRRPFPKVRDFKDKGRQDIDARRLKNRFNDFEDNDLAKRARKEFVGKPERFKDMKERLPEKMPRMDFDVEEGVAGLSREANRIKKKFVDDSIRDATDEVREEETDKAKLAIANKLKAKISRGEIPRANDLEEMRSEEIEKRENSPEVRQRVQKRAMQKGIEAGKAETQGFFGKLFGKKKQAKKAKKSDGIRKLQQYNKTNLDSLKIDTIGENELGLSFMPKSDDTRFYVYGKDKKLDMSRSGRLESEGGKILKKIPRADDLSNIIVFEKNQNDEWEYNRIELEGGQSSEEDFSEEQDFEPVDGGLGE